MKSTQETVLTNPLITPQHLARKALIYIRQSSPDQVERNTGSQAFQRDQTELARAYGWPDDLIKVVDEDLGKSGSVVDRRTGWQTMLDQIAAHGVGCVFATSISRLGRELLPIEQLRIMALYHGALLCLDNRLSDPSNPNDTVLTQITATFAQYENKKRTEHMTHARMAKAKQGAVVSALPVGWIKGPDGEYDYDPETKDTIRMIIKTFWQTRSIRRTVTALAKAGVQIPSRHGKRISFKKPTLDRVTRILTHPAYAGTYVYGRTQCQPGGLVLASGQSKRINTPEERWIKTFNHHPAYMSQEQQEQIKSIFSRNLFQRRDRAGRGSALTQGLLRCAVCGERLAVSYHRNKSYSYGCWKGLKYAEKPCTWFVSYDFDQYILREVFKVLKTPPIDMLKSALEASRSHEQMRLSWIESERERLAHEERVAQDRADLTRGNLPRVHFDALKKLEKVLEEKEQFEQKIAIKRLGPTSDESEEELEELCRLASDVPSLWGHATVTHQERKEILRCVIDHVVVAATKERVDATIFWKTGEPTPISIWRGVGRYNLIRELYAQKLTVLEMKEHLAAGKTSTGQVVNITEGRLYVILHKLHLTPNRFSAGYLALGKKAAELNREGRSLEWIARHFNEQGYASASGKSWTRNMVFGLHRAIGSKTELLENIHRSAMTEARARGLNDREMALEFNEKQIRRRGGQHWTARNIRKRWFDLTRLQGTGAQKGLMTTALSEPVVLPRSE
jgi:DNA invertase Pin-like site-specific DNA recombinase